MKDSLERCHCASSNCYCANIKRAENKITALYNRHLEKAGITRGQYALLANIERNPGISVSALAETMDLERTTLVRNLKPLEARGLIVDAACKGRSRSLSAQRGGKGNLCPGPHLLAAGAGRAGSLFGPGADCGIEPPDLRHFGTELTPCFSFFLRWKILPLSCIYTLLKGGLSEYSARKNNPPSFFPGKLSFLEKIGNWCIIKPASNLYFR